MNVARIPRLVARSSHQIARHYATEVPRRPIGGFRGGLFGFILGVTLTGAVGYYYLLDEYHAASSLLLNSVEELQASTNRVRDYAKKIEGVEKQLQKLRDQTVTKDQLADLRTEAKKLYDSLNIEHLELKTHVWGLEQDVHKLSRPAQ
ncbi:hypothetical protein BZG36_02376 [Bifiguratus adelaidae]|uniref:Uncharacterized protein n=1 Tax=Bifiguratus adelaidae TaxID=1938954 RepID=A0A261Y165_9FUNG|nr:hypothetical protein BZG36_02376 [Bifiguratus adelaidae]